MLVAVAAMGLLAACSSVKHVPDGSYLVDKVTIDVQGGDVRSSELVNYLRQTPNHKVLGLWKFQLGAYNLSGRDSTKWYNRWLQRVGQAPVIYDQELTDLSQRQLQLAMINRGYMDAVVTVDTLTRPKKKRIEVTYHVDAGEAHRIRTVTYNIPDSAIASIVLADTLQYAPKSGEPLDRTRLDEIRERITTRLHNSGYYAFSKEYITFYADTAANSTDIDITMNVGASAAAMPYYINNVYFVTDYEPGQTVEQIHREAVDSVQYRGVWVLYGTDRYIKPGVLEEKCFLTPGTLYSEDNINRTYQALTRLSILRTINISVVPSGSEGGVALLDVYVLLQRNKKQSITLELEGTNSEGDLGVGGSVTYQHRNMGHRSELFTAKVRANYESISGNLDGFVNNRYTEYAGELGVTYPKFLFPFLSHSYRRRVRASTEFAVSFNYQERPEYTRIIAGAAWKYKWNNRLNTTRRTFDLLDINYVYLPNSTIDFINQIAPDNPLLRYSYEDHLIMRLGYTYVHTNKRTATAIGVRRYQLQPTVYTIRLSAETAGNLLYGISNMIGQHKDDGVYKVLGVPYSQYVKGEVDFTYTRNFSTRHSVAFHIGGGIAYPYGNSEAVPFEKRFYAGGANGVRGWSVRTLGPGSYDSRNSVTSFINQCGDISLLMSAEYRAKLFWVLEAGLFIDAGNIWTIHSYENQPGGLFKFNSFYKEIAWAYGIGLRLDFTYFLFRIDLGMKAYNPARNQQRWPLTHPDWHRDSTIHFSVGYPF